MSEDAEARREIIRRLFYLITIAAEAAALAVEGQSRRLAPDDARASAANLLELGIRIEILSSAIMELLEGAEKGAEAI